MNESSLHVPMGVKTENEFFPGFGKKEFLQASAGAALGALISLIVFIISGNAAYAMTGVLSGIAGSVMMTTKDQYNLSVVTQVASLIRFSRSQKFYPYVYGQEWEVY
ncbi:MAG: hypothetical protein LBL37_06185 [Gracilibacteraceae bacterium]|jgi:hypothetical protein|nr:hypothetical protein [Gracilibacteraceae bacterium]MDR1320672.1 hypothetical protein [Gracilibacteraceae bacterium]